MKKLISLAICLAMVLAFSASAFAKPIGGLVVKDPAAVTEFKQMVDAIGEVTLEDKDAIEAAEAFYDENNLGKYVMDGMRQNANCVAAYETLVAAREAYDTLVANQGTTDTPAGGNSGAETPDTPVEPEKPAREPKTMTINGASITVEGDKWLYNEAVETATAANYQMIIFDKGFEGTFTTNGYGCAVVLNEYGELVKIYAGAYAQFWTSDGQVSPSGITANDYATKAWEQLEDGELLIIFPNDGGSNTARNWALDLRGLKGTKYFDEVATLTGFTFKTRPVNPPVDDPIDPPVDPIDPTGDTTFVIFALVALSMTGLVVLTSKKRAF